MKNGFVLIEFVIALPLLILLLFALGKLTFELFQMSRVQVADYVLETETQRILDRIVEDAKAAKYVEIKKVRTNEEFQLYEIFFEYQVATSAQPMAVAVRAQRLYTPSAMAGHGYYIYAERQQHGNKSNPISGGNFFGDTQVTQLKFSVPSDKVLHITLEMRSSLTGRKIKLNTSVYMSACGVINL